MSYYDTTDYATDYSNDFTEDVDYGAGYGTESAAWADASEAAWTDSIDYSAAGDDAWLAGNTELANEYYEASEHAEGASGDYWDASWEAYDGPVDASGYTAADLSAGYSATDTSFIEPASYAGASSLIA